MSTQEIIKELCKKRGITVSSLEQELGFSNSSLKGTGAIKSDRLLAVAKYFGVSMEYLMGTEDVTSDNESYYFNDDAKEMAQFLFSNPEYRVLFDASRKVKAEDLEKAVKMLGLLNE